MCVSTFLERWVESQDEVSQAHISDPSKMRANPSPPAKRSKAPSESELEGSGTKLVGRPQSAKERPRRGFEPTPRSPLPDTRTERACADIAKLLALAYHRLSANGLGFSKEVPESTSAGLALSAKLSVHEVVR
jgi:hypothetical protein